VSNQGASDWPDLSGRLVDDASGLHHVLPIRVYFEDTDFSGLVYHASYVRWCERGRSDFLRLLGNDHRGLIAGGEREPASFVVRRMGLEFLKPGHIDDVVEVVTRPKALGAASLTLDQRIRRIGGGPHTELMTAEVMVVLVSQSGKVMRLTGLLRDAFLGRTARGRG
jgi:acyl-CoA thioester hydrolase